MSSPSFGFKSFSKSLYTYINSNYPPSISRYKVNVDGAVFASQKSVGTVFASQKSVGVGALSRDSYGQVVAAISKKINAPLGPLEAEVKAWEEGVKFAREVGVYDFTLEGDSLVVFNALRGLSNPPAAVESVIRGVLMACGSCYRVDFSHIKRQGNRSAHFLAKHALGIVDFETWMESLLS
nr:hypothetical protein CFP56_18443 [Quercus suber]